MPHTRKNFHVDGVSTTSGWVNVDEMQIRIINSLHSKKDQRNKWIIKEAPFEKVPFVVAVNPAISCIKASSLDDSELLGCVAPIGAPCGIYSQEKDKFIGFEYAKKSELKKTPEKSNKPAAMIANNIFCGRNDFNSISAVLFSRINYTGLYEAAFDKYEMYKSFVLVHNGHANNPLPRGLLKVNKEYVVNKNEIRSC